MTVRGLRLNLCVLVLASVPLASLAGDGLVAPSAETVWPQWQARIAVQTAAVSPLGLSRLLESSGAQRAAQGGAVLGDYYFAQPSFGNFRASGGLMFGGTGGAPLLSATAGPHLGLSIQGVGSTVGPAADNAGTVPYLGLGFTSAAGHKSLSLSADLGLVAEQPSAALGVGRTLLGNQGRENAWRELRLSPVMQLGLRYRF